MKILKVIAGGLLVLMALLWLPQDSVAQGSGACVAEWGRLDQKVDSSDHKGLDQIIAELIKLSQKCGTDTKLGNSIRHSLNRAKVNHAKLGYTHGEADEAGNAIERASQTGRND